MSRTCSDAVFDYMSDRMLTMSEATLRRDDRIMTCFCAAIEVQGRDFFGLSVPEEVDLVDVLPEERLGEAMPLLLEFVQERFSDDPSEYKQLLTGLRSFYRWLGARPDRSETAA